VNSREDKVHNQQETYIDNRFEVPQDGCERGPNEGQQVRNKPCFADQDVEKGLMDLNELMNEKKLVSFEVSSFSGWIQSLQW
jgi:hypothetical protein